MKISICSVILVVLVSIGANKANDGIIKDSMHIHTLVKRAPACGYASCSYLACCYGYSCISGFCKTCTGRNCTSNNDCCDNYTCSYKKCIKKRTGGGGVPPKSNTHQH
ncbi:uncharacterized protein [Mytilus edulis]|uniref:uncharacterized protein n=1 Tax=Mytilus edulis TaxID=6550 RepID=UPI0039EFB968